MITSSSTSSCKPAITTWARRGSACLLALALSSSLYAQSQAQPHVHVHTHEQDAPASANTGSGATTQARLPTDSVYHLHVPLTGQNGRTWRLDDLAGRPVLVSMFYGSCKFVCPMLIDTMRATSEQLQPLDRDRVVRLLVSIDPGRDSVAALARLGEVHKLDPARWTLARTDAKSVRKLAAVLGIQYRALPDGEFNHSTELILLDTQGHITARTAKMGAVDAAFGRQGSTAAAATRP